MGRLEDLVVRSIFARYSAQPKKSIPRTSSGGVQEWVPLSGIAVVEGRSHLSNASDSTRID
jgi:hypothetical protein